MNVYKNTCRTARGREWKVASVTSRRMPKAINEAVGVSPRTVRKRVKRHAVEGIVGLQDRSSRPCRLCLSSMEFEMKAGVA